ncbi:MAG: rhomboid family intramembrane serine protease [Hyphomonadaceae bacterium]|nr:rhomboid family intramembrane serine protease [Hyphomonadaceae bacterium]
MTEAQAAPPPLDKPPREKFFSNFPVVVAATAILLVGLYTAYFFAPFDDQQSTLFNFALAPERFWAEAGSPKVYPDIQSALLTLVSTSLLHGDWVHVIVNTLMLVQFGAPVSQALGPGIAGAGKWMLVFIVSIIAGSLLYLGLQDADGPYAVGASGGVSGLIAAAFLMDPYTWRKRTLWSREFLLMTLYFIIINIVLVFGGPFVGLYVAWEAHAGGYIAGAILMAVMPLRGLPARAPRAAES